MNKMQLFNFEDQQVRTLLIDSVPYFVGKDVTDILGYKNASKALIDHVDDEDKLNNETLSSLGQRGGWLINESGLYSLILSSQMPDAKKFKHWVTSEVLPAIRKTGSYQIPQTPEEQLKLTMQVTNRLVGRVDKVEKDLQHIKDTAEVDEQERYELLQARKARVMKACGGEDSNYYQEKKLVSADAKELWKERIDLLQKRMASTNKEEWDKFNNKSLEIEAEQKRRKEVL